MHRSFEELGNDIMPVSRRQAKRATRAEKQQAGKKARTKFEEDVRTLIRPIIPQTENQSIYLAALQRNQLVVAKGSAGSGKTWMAASWAANQYLKGEVSKIIITRPIVPMGRSTGYWPGGINEKILPYVQPIVNNLKKRIGVGKFEADFGKSILIQPLEAIRGMSFEEGTIIILDEAQSTMVEEIRSIVTRLEEGSQLIVCGDDKQKDIKGLSGITYLADIISKNAIPDCAVVEFTSKDIVRSGLTKRFVEIFDKEGSAGEVEKQYKGV